MGKINLYVAEADEPVMEKLRAKLERENKSMSEFVIEAANDYLAHESAEPQEIELDGFGVKRIFKGNTLYWSKDRDNEIGVFLTAKHKIAYWNCTPGAVNEEERGTFKTYDDLDAFFEDQDWLNKRHSTHIKAEIQREYAALIGRPVIERLDI
jgi:hypothetical protein